MAEAFTVPGRPLYNESMSVACQYGQCEVCPDSDADLADDDLMCTCVCHIPDDSDVDVV